MIYGTYGIRLWTYNSLHDIRDISNQQNDHYIYNFRHLLCHPLRHRFHYQNKLSHQHRRDIFYISFQIHHVPGNRISVFSHRNLDKNWNLFLKNLQNEKFMGTASLIVVRDTRTGRSPSKIINTFCPLNQGQFRTNLQSNSHFSPTLNNSLRLPQPCPCSY